MGSSHVVKYRPRFVAICAYGSYVPVGVTAEQQQQTLERAFLPLDGLS
jgi:hypothetical protein